MKLTRPERPGNVCVLMAFCITILVGVAAVAIDGGAIMDDVQKAQAAADASALAAAEQIYRLWQTGNGLDVGSNAKNAALALAATNGYANDGTDSQITPNAVMNGQNGQGGGTGSATTPLQGICIPPVSGDHVGQKGNVEVVSQDNQQH